LVPAVDSVLSIHLIYKHLKLSNPDVLTVAGLPAIVVVPVLDFVPPVATSLLLLPSLLLAVASISADFEFTILAGVLTFNKKLNVSDNGYLIIFIFVLLADCWTIKKGIETNSKKHRTIEYQTHKNLYCPTLLVCNTTVFDFVRREIVTSRGLGDMGGGEGWGGGRVRSRQTKASKS
jgi:hypothetical protein